jgi:hypothetical protein
LQLEPPEPERTLDVTKTATARSATRPQDVVLSSWGAFAGIMLFLAGTFTFLYGLGAVLNDKAVTVGGNGGVILWDFTTWGWVQIVLGLALVGVALGLFATRGWARWSAVVLAALNAIAQVSIISAFPIYALIVITLDAVVIYHLTVRWYDS